MDFLQQLGTLALASRLKRLTDRLYRSGEQIYTALGVDFQPRWFMVVARLREAGDQALPITVIARDLGVTHPGIIKLIREMEKKGLVTSVQDQADARKRGVLLTAKGKRLVSELEPIWAAFETVTSELFEELDCDLITLINRFEILLADSSLASRVLTKIQARGAVEIIDYHPDLAKHFRCLNEEWLKEEFRIEAHDRKQLDNPEAEILDPGGEILFARKGDHIIGTVALVRLSHQRFELAKMAVAKEFRGKGIGSNLVRAAIDRARERGATSLVLQTHSKHRAAAYLYREHGFEVKRVGIPSASHVERARNGFSMVLNLRNCQRF